MNDIVFSSQEELFDRIKPALRSKKKMLSRKGLKKITEEDLWEFMRDNIWKNITGLELCDMVDQVLHTDDTLVMEYYQNKYLSKDMELPKKKSE